MTKLVDLSREVSLLINITSPLVLSFATVNFGLSG
jgi:hypothetical protein